ncbi:MAG: GNAT family N-acetyltransferase [Gordonia sp. (in: high G+C Gram-positive bacteria)]|uniref:GNAT family N-acetyltransferase n=1 Tax=Gordonia sp. (in: high G+C Gram-positive bacteria) TaxID=84139 RepID=UPI0039E3DB06
MSKQTIRPYAATDRAELLTLAERAGEGAPTESLWGHSASELDIYLTPYLDEEPESVFVAEVDGKLVGYLVGSLGDGKVDSEDDRMSAVIQQHRLFLIPSVIRFFARAAWDTFRNRGRESAGEFHDPAFPAHLHINVAPEARGTGLAGKLVDAFVAHARKAKCPGIYLQTLVENERATKFFTKEGFEPRGAAPRVPGMRYRGKPVHQLTMVRSL